MARKKQTDSPFMQAFPKTVPVMVGYLFLGIAYGILMSVNGFGAIWAVLMSIIVYAGSLQYVGINLLTAAVSPAAAFLMALMINARHLFYGISMLGKYSEFSDCQTKPFPSSALSPGLKTRQRRENFSGSHFLTSATGWQEPF